MHHVVVSAFLLLTLLDCFRIHAASHNNTLLFGGTVAGYDVGGPEPVCWISQLHPNDAYGYATIIDRPAIAWGLEEWNAYFLSAQGGSGSVTQLQPSCDGGLKNTSTIASTITATTTRPQQQLEEQRDSEIYDDDSHYYYTNEPYNLTLTTTANTSGAGLHARVVLCHIFRTGFCSPLRVDNNHDDPYVIHSDWYTLPNDDHNYNFSWTIPASTPPGAYQSIGHVVRLSQERPDDDASVAFRYDTASVIELIHIGHRPVRQSMTRTAKITLAIIIGACMMFVLYLLLYLVKYRHDTVLQLAQGKFLAALTLGCAVQMVASSFIFFPTHSIFCSLFGSLILLPLTFVASCLVGRVWRVHKTLSIVQTLGRRQASGRAANMMTAAKVENSLIAVLDVLARLPFLCWQRGKRAKRNPRRSIRESVSDGETAVLIVVLTLPQLVFQLFVLFGRKNRELVDLHDELNNTVRSFCDLDGRWTTGVGLVYMMTILILAVAMAWVSRSLPSAFNEKGQIFRAASLSTVVAFLSIALWKPITDKGSSPDLSAILQILLSVSVSMIVLIIIVLPKIRRSQSGEKVVMSNLVSARFLGNRPPSRRKAPSSRSAKLSIPSSINALGSSYLDDRLSSRLPTIESGIEAVEEDEEDNDNAPVQLSALAQESSRTFLKRDDPFPEDLETTIYGFQAILREITQKFAQGRAVSSDLFSELRGSVSILAEQLDTIDVAEDRVEMRTSAK